MLDKLPGQYFKMSTVCANCGKTWGAHIGVLCPYKGLKSASTFVPVDTNPIAGNAMNVPMGLDKETVDWIVKTIESDIHPQWNDSKWVIAKEATECTNTVCGKPISIGDLCCEHSTDGFGCKECAAQYWRDIKHVSEDLTGVPMIKPEPEMVDSELTTLYKAKWHCYWVITSKPHVCEFSGPFSKCGKVEIPAGDIAMRTLRAPIQFYCKLCVSQYGDGDVPPMELVNIWNQKQNNPDAKVITITSFSYKKGLPEITPGSKILDVRHTIRNPWRDPALRKLTGLDPQVKEYINRCPKTAVVLQSASYYPSVGYRNIFVGCFGGKHRSVAIAEMLAERYRASAHGYTVNVIHRDLKSEGVED